VVAALHCVGTDEAVDVSLALVADRERIVTIAAAERRMQAAGATSKRWESIDQGQLFFSSSASMTMIPLGPRT
jgi:hypothetical protein